MYEIFTLLFKPTFVRLYKKADPHLKEEIEDTIEKLRNINNHNKLKVHKLSGKLKDFYSCSINYKQRIVFEFKDEGTIILVLFGGHEIYK